MFRQDKPGHPLWLHASAQQALVYDLDCYAQRFSVDAGRLFVPEGETFVKLIRLGQKDGRPVITLRMPPRC